MQHIRHKAAGARSHSRGFTLIEMLAVTAIIVIISSVLLFSNRAFGGTIILKSLAYDVALSIREAQTYGISVRESGGSFESGYGVEIRRAANDEYLLYADSQVPMNGFYDGVAELVTKYTLQSGYTISDICYTNTVSGSEVCGSASILDINFVRPEPNACIGVDHAVVLTQTGSASPKCANNKASARIVLKAPNGDTASVLVDVTGQISVQ